MGRCAADCKSSQLFRRHYFPLTCRNIQVSGLWNPNPSPPEGRKRKTSWTECKNFARSAHTHTGCTAKHCACMLARLQKLFNNQKMRLSSCLRDCRTSSMAAAGRLRPGNPTVCKLAPPLSTFLHAFYSFSVDVTLLSFLSCGVTNGYLLNMCWTLVTMHSTWEKSHSSNSS